MVRKLTAGAIVALLGVIMSPDTNVAAQECDICYEYYTGGWIHAFDTHGVPDRVQASIFLDPLPFKEPSEWSGHSSLVSGTCIGNHESCIPTEELQDLRDLLASDESDGETLSRFLSATSLKFTVEERAIAIEGCDGALLMKIVMPPRFAGLPTGVGSPSEPPRGDQ